MENGTKYAWLDMAKRMQALAQAGLEYSDNKYDRDRYQQMRELSLEIMHDFTELKWISWWVCLLRNRGIRLPRWMSAESFSGATRS